MVEPEGFEPTTSCLQSRRSPSELRPRRADLEQPTSIAGYAPCPPIVPFSIAE